MTNTLRDVLFLEPRVFTDAEREALRAQLRVELPRLRRLLDAADAAVNRRDPEAALVHLGVLARASISILFPM